MQNKKQIFYWALYDFANAIVMIVFFLYFTQWMVVDKHLSDLGFNMIFVGSSILLLLTAPILSSIADKWNNRLIFIRPITVGAFVGYLICGIIANFFPSMLWLAVIVFMLGNFLYQLSYVFYNPILHELSNSQNRGKISAIGMTASWLGQIVGVLIAFPLAQMTHPLFGVGIAGRPQTFIPIAIIFFLLSLPMLTLFKEQGVSSIVPISLKNELKNFSLSFKALWLIPGMALFLLAFFFYNDAVVTAGNNFPIYLEKVFGVSDNLKSLALLGILVTSAIGAFFAGSIADRVGLKKSLQYIVGGWIIIMPILAYQTNFWHFAIALVFMGFLYGAVSTVARAYMVHLSDPKQLNFAFSFFTLTERCATFIGPLGWGLSLYFMSSLGHDAYRYSFLTLMVFMIIGFILIRKIKK